MTRTLGLAGRWSLVIYLVHQPLIVGLLALVALVVPPSRETARQNFMNQCLAQCPAGEDGAPICTPLCGCMFDKLYGTPMFSVTSPDALTPEQKAEIDGMLKACANAVAPTPGAAN